MKPLRFLLMLVISVLVIACAAKDPLRIASNGEDDYGIGGTGIVGTVTGFGSIFVNGIEVELSDQTTLGVNGQRVAEHPFQIGETVEIRVADAASYTHALTLNIRHEVIGPVASWDQERQLLQVLGQQIRVAQDNASWLPGQFVAVSGYLDQDGIIQARLVQNYDGNRILLRGDANEIQQQLDVSGISIAGDNRLSAFKGAVVLEGNLQKQMLDIQRIQMQSLLPFKGVTNWRIEGYAGRYSAQWPELKKLGQSGTEPLQFELKLDPDGEVSVQQLKAVNLRRGAQQYHAPVINRQQNQGNRQSGAGSKRHP